MVIICENISTNNPMKHQQQQQQDFSNAATAATIMSSVRHPASPTIILHRFVLKGQKFTVLLPS